MQTSTPIILGEDDFYILKQYVGHVSEKNQDHIHTLSGELSEAIVVEDNILPRNCVRLGSFIRVRSVSDESILEFSIVIPEEADKEKKRISVLDTLGGAFIGLCNSEKIERNIDGCAKIYEIMEVIH